ncbi:MAG: hypothetical protein LBR25_07310 [Erysipelotrichaceae bacterium]|jgi:hypothetical protein|nr:hypothetical protein [Erysipelotrichaceae bacterium]
MRKLLKNSVFRILIILAGDLCLFVFLFTYIIPNKLTHPLTILLTILLFVAFAFIFTMTMVCELCYDEASKNLVAKADLEQAYIWIKRMRKWDLFHWYNSQYYVFMTIYYRDYQDYKGLAELLKHKVFDENDSTRLVADYHHFLLAIENRQSGEVKEYFARIQRTYEQNRNKKGAKIALVYSFAQIQAEKAYYENDCKGALHYLSKVPLDRLNHREQGHYYFLKYLVCLKNRNLKQAQNALAKAKEQYPNALFLKNA